MKSAEILRGLGIDPIESVPAVPVLSRNSRDTETLDTWAVPVVPVVPDEKHKDEVRDMDEVRDIPLSAKLRALGQPIALEVDDVVVCWLVSDEDAQRRTDLNPRITGEEAEALTQFSGPEIRDMLATKARVGGTVDESGLHLPASVHCIDCKHFVRKDHPHLGRCAADVKPDGAAGLWDTDKRMCRHYESLEPTR